MNVICLELGQISQQGEALITGIQSKLLLLLVLLLAGLNMMIGDPVFCSNSQCKAIFNSGSKIVDKDGDQEWKCEFCGANNTVHLDAEEVCGIFKNNILYFLKKYYPKDPQKYGIGLHPGARS